MTLYRRLVIYLTLAILTCPRCTILIPAVVLFIFSYSVLYEFTIKRLNSILAHLFSEFSVGSITQQELFPAAHLTKVTFLNGSFFDLKTLISVNLTIFDSDGVISIVSPLDTFPISLTNSLVISKSLLSFFVKFVNYDLRTPYTYFNKLLIVDDLLDDSTELSIYILHDLPIKILSVLSYTSTKISSVSLISQFTNWINLQNGYGSFSTFVSFFDSFLLCLIIGFLVYVYISLVNQHKLRSSFGLLCGWFFVLCASAAASIRVTAMLHNKCWKLLFLPLTTFHKLVYLSVALFLSADNLFAVLDHFSKKLEKLHHKILTMFINKWNLPLNLPNFLVSVLILCILISIDFLLGPFFEESIFLTVTNATSLFSQSLIICLVIDSFIQSTFLMGIIVIDTKRIGLTEVMKAKRGEDDIFGSDNDDSRYHYLNSSFQPEPKLNFMKSIKKIRYGHNQPLVIVVFSLLYIVGCFHSILIFPNLLRYVINPPIVHQSHSWMYYLELLSILSFAVAISLSIFTFTKSYSMTQFIRLESSDFEVEKKTFHNIELDDGHDLDIIQIKSNPNTSFVISIGMDHKIFIWSPLAKGSKPISIATTITLDESGNPILAEPKSSLSKLESNLFHKQYSNRDLVERYLQLSSNPISEDDFLALNSRESSTDETAEDLLIENNVTSPASSISTPLHLVVKEFWPINHVNISDDGNFIILFNQKYGVFKCYERKQLSYIWECRLPLHILKLVESKQFKVLKSFFRKKTVLGFLALKIFQKKHSDRIGNRRGSQISLSSMGSKMNGNFPPMPTQNHLEENLPEKSKLGMSEKMEFVMVLESGHGLVLNCVDGSIKEFNVLASAYPGDYENRKLISAKKVITPRINDRIVFQVSGDDDLIIATAVNNYWKFRKLSVCVGYSNQAIRQVYPEDQQRINKNDFKAVYDSQSPSQFNPLTSRRLVDSNIQINKPTLITIQFVGMLVRVKNLVAELIDIQTGLILKSFAIGRFKTKSLKVSHSEPTHCKFCGCASIKSFSVVYEDHDTPTIILHTFKIDIPRSKINICLRVERDPREIRCLGFNSVTEHQHWYENVEGWEMTAVNMIIGLRKNPTIDELEIVEDIKNPSFDQLVERSGLQSLRNRKKKKQTKVTKLEKSSKVWEGFIISVSDGKLIEYELPTTRIEDNVNLSSGKINCIEKYGYKSIIINICNMLEIFYLGNDKLIEEDIYYSGNKADVWSILEDESVKESRPNQTVNNELLFINKRRKMRDRHQMLPI